MTELEERLRAGRPDPSQRRELDDEMRLTTRRLLELRQPKNRRPVPVRLAVAIGALLVLASVAAAISFGPGILARTPGEGSAAGRLSATGEIAAWIEGGGGPSKVMVNRRAQDGTWSAPELLAEGGNDVRVAKAPDGTAVAVWTTVGGVFSSQLGHDGTWSAGRLIDGSEGPAMRLDLSYLSGGSLLAAWQTETTPKRAMVALNTQGTWEAASTLPTPPGGEAFEPAVGIGSDGTLVVAWQVLDRDGAQVLATTRPAGSSWSEVVTLGQARSAGNAQVAASKDGRVFATWTERANDTDGERVMFSGVTAGGGWLEPVQVSASGSALEPRVAPLLDGAVVLWAQIDPTDPTSARRQLLAATVTPDGTVSEATPLSAAAGSAITPALASDSGGRAVVVWADRVSESKATLKVAQRLPDGSWHENGAVSDGQGYAFMPSVALTPSGALVLWTEVKGDETLLRTATVPTEGADAWRGGSAYPACFGGRCISG